MRSWPHFHVGPLLTQVAVRIFIPPGSRGLAVRPAQDHDESQRRCQEEGDPADPVLDQTDTSPQEVAERNRRRGPEHTAEDAVYGEFSPGHAAHARDERAKNSQARDKARQEDRPPPVLLEEPLSAVQAIGRDEGVPSPPQHERASAEATDEVA